MPRKREMSEDLRVNGISESRYLVAQNWLTGKFVVCPSEEIIRSEMVSNRTLPLHCGIVHRDHLGARGLKEGFIEIVSRAHMKVLCGKRKKPNAVSAVALPYEYSLVLAMGRCIVFLHVTPRISFFVPTLAWQERFEPHGSPWVSKLRMTRLAAPGAVSIVPTIAHGSRNMTRIMYSLEQLRLIFGCHRGSE